MFERNRVDNAAPTQLRTTPAEIELDDGRILKGNFVMPASRPIYEVLNGRSTFLDFQPHDEEPRLIARTAIRCIKLIDIPSADHLKARKAQMEQFDPYAILGVEKGSDWEMVRNAYHKLAKRYHPDRYANINLPPEVSDYLAAVSKRINAAFAAVEIPHQTIKRAKSRPQPIYESQPRA